MPVPARAERRQRLDRPRQALFGINGSIVAYLGFFGLPFCWVLALASFYAEFATSPGVKPVVIGVAAAGAGLFIGTAIKLGRSLARKPAALVVVAGCFIAGGVGRVSNADRHSARRGDLVLLLEARAAMRLGELGLYFSLLSLLSVGGMSPVIPEMHRYVVEAKGWISHNEFGEMFALGQVAPGPNGLIASLIGWKIAGVPGTVVTLAAMCGPTAVLSFWG